MEKEHNVETTDTQDPTAPPMTDTLRRELTAQRLEKEKKEERKARIQTALFITIPVFIVLSIIAFPSFMKEISFSTKRGESIISSPACKHNLRVLGDFLISHAESHDGRFPQFDNAPPFTMASSDVISEIGTNYLHCIGDKHDLDKIQEGYVYVGCIKDDYLTAIVITDLWEKTQPDNENETIFESKTEPDRTGLRQLHYWNLSYIYLGYKVDNMDNGIALMDLWNSCGSLEESQWESIASQDGGYAFEPLHLSMRDDPELAAKVPLLFERSANHLKDGIYVLYLDGHIEFVNMGEKFPAYPSFLERFPILKMRTCVMERTEEEINALNADIDKKIKEIHGEDVILLREGE